MQNGRIHGEMEDYILQNVAIFFKFVVRHLQNVIDFDNTNANGTILHHFTKNSAKQADIPHDGSWQDWGNLFEKMDY